MSNINVEIRQAKVKLYLVLLKQLSDNPSLATENEIELGYRLALDEDIQQVFKNAKKEKP